MRYWKFALLITIFKQAGKYSIFFNQTSIVEKKFHTGTLFVIRHSNTLTTSNIIHHS